MSPVLIVRHQLLNVRFVLIFCIMTSTSKICSLRRRRSDPTFFVFIFSFQSVYSQDFEDVHAKRPFKLDKSEELEEFILEKAVAHFYYQPWSSKCRYRTYPAPQPT